MYQTWGSQPQATASFKLDGSLIIAFLWQGQLYTCTRITVDSEQVRDFNYSNFDSFACRKVKPCCTERSTAGTLQDQ